MSTRATQRSRVATAHCKRSDFPTNSTNSGFAFECLTALVLGGPDFKTLLTLHIQQKNFSAGRGWASRGKRRASTEHFYNNSVKLYYRSLEGAQLFLDYKGVLNKYNALTYLHYQLSQTDNS